MTMFWLCTLCIVFFIIIIILLVRIHSIHKAMDELCSEISIRLQEDTNVGIDISVNDRKMRRLAADMDRQLKLLRKEHIRYTLGDQELKKAITNISHDLRTPLTAICGYMDLLSQEEMSDTVKEYISIINNRVQTLKELTEELFRYSVIMSVDSYDLKEEVSLNSALEECIAAYYGALKDVGIEPKISMPETGVKRNLNKQALSRILSNIVSNVIKYSDGDFSVILEENGTLHFCNKASRLDEVQVGHLFDRFFTVENGRNATGLGLSIAKTLTEEMNGQMEAEYKNGILNILVKFPL